MQNFWEITGWENNDWHINKLRSMPFERTFPFIPQKKGLYIIRGPRQIGKSSWLKTMLSFYAKEDPASCFYYSCENLKDSTDLQQLLKSIKNKKYILLDEISFVSDWARAVKHHIEEGHNHVLVLTGSDAHDLRTGMDRMPGRFENGGEYLLLPMDFFEFSKMRKQAGWNSLSKEQELLLFFKIGGFPIAVAEAGAEGKTPLEAIETYKKWLTGDFIRRGKQETYLREILSQLALSMGSSISLQKLASKTQMGSHHTAQEYVALLEDCFALRTIYAVDPNTGAFQFRKEKKFYFTDPLIFWLALSWVNIKNNGDRDPQIAELCSCEFLSRIFTRFGYYSSQKGEIDFYSKDKWAIEIKWSDAVHNLSNSFKKINIPQKIVWCKTNIFEELPQIFPS